MMRAEVAMFNFKNQNPVEVRLCDICGMRMVNCAWNQKRHRHCRLRKKEMKIQKEMGR